MRYEDPRIEKYLSKPISDKTKLNILTEAKLNIQKSGFEVTNIAELAKNLKSGSKISLIGSKIHEPEGSITATEFRYTNPKGLYAGIQRSKWRGEDPYEGSIEGPRKTQLTFGVKKPKSMFGLKFGKNSAQIMFTGKF